VRIFLDALDEAVDGVPRNVVADIRRINLSQQVSKSSTSLPMRFSCRYSTAIVVDDGLEICVDRYDQNDILHYALDEL
jgi:hypothetical protein